MRGNRHVLGIFFLVVIALLLAGCTKELVCGPPSVIIGNSCCPDDNNDQVCDAEQQVVKAVENVSTVETGTAEVTTPKETVVKTETVKTAAVSSAGSSAAEMAAETFASTWDGKGYNALSSLFVNNYRLKFSANEFNFLARKVDAQIGIKGVSLRSVEDDIAIYEVSLSGKKLLVTADLDEDEGKYLHDAFYFFENLTPELACGNDSSCFMDYALISKDQNYCSKAGSLKGDCVETFGVSKTLSARIDVCMQINEYYSQVDCLEKLAVNENSPEPCWQATYDKQTFECMGLVAAARKDVDECHTLVRSKGNGGTTLQDTYCILGYVKETGDTDACAKIDRRQDTMLGAMQEGCYKMNFP